MKKTLLAICALLIISCSKKEEKTEQKNIQEEKQIVENTSQSIEKLQALLSRFEDQSQFFDISSSKPSLVKGKKGTIIHIDLKNLELENGQAIGNNLKVELKELTNQNDLLKNNTQTISDGKLLVSGGSYFIAITSNGEKVNLKKGKTLEVEFPKITNRNMELFYGERDSLNQMNWTTTNTKFRNQILTTNDKIYNTDPIAESDLTFTVDGNIIESDNPHRKARKLNKIDTKIYESIKLSKLGWINCDAFYGKPTDIIFFEFDQKQSFSIVKTFAIFKNINSIMSVISYKEKNSSTLNKTIMNLPIGEKIKIISFSYKGKKVYSDAQMITVTKNSPITLSLKETPEKDIEKLFKI